MNSFIDLYKFIAVVYLIDPEGQFFQGVPPVLYVPACQSIQFAPEVSDDVPIQNKCIPIELNHYLSGLAYARNIFTCRTWGTTK